MTLDELKEESKAEAKKNKSAAVRWALLELGHPKSKVGKADVEEFLKTNKVKTGLEGNAVSVAINNAKTAIAKKTGNAPAAKRGKGKTKRTPTKVASYDEAATLLAELDSEVADKLEFARLAIKQAGGDLSKAKQALGILKG